MEPSSLRQDPPDEIDAQWNQLTATGCADWWLMTRAVRQYLPGGWYRQQEADPAGQLTAAAPPAAPAASTATAAGAAASSQGTLDGTTAAAAATQPPQQQQPPSQQAAAPALAGTGARAAPAAAAAHRAAPQQQGQPGCGVPIKSCFTCHAADPEAVLDTRSQPPNHAVTQV